MMRTDLGWELQKTLADGLRQTVAWYLSHRDWWQPLLSEEYQALCQRLAH
jgi:dTDP-glucose 4,6-dehydratase